jgi:hypothetical protein
MPELDAIKSYTRLARMARSKGAPEQALLHLSNALRLARECGLTVLEARARHAMGQIYALSGRPDLAACCCRTALELLRRDASQAASRSLARSLAKRVDASLERLGAA